ncbi:hypothetical protein ASPCAL07143 [Aspergillus calidoustus]|uniref:Enoyl-CoA hydratase/isomerase family protein n=1 Tax=Aspergillus calidoustus TaxID=454130 RepID=A0A0U5G2S9_ASPCI|nr:hypothetical protein ASPCAL07143 [Aspergillus calidoustus]
MAQKEESAKLVLVETHPSGIRVCILNRPTKRNALSQGLIDELLLQLRLAESDEEISCIIITGSGGIFSGMYSTHPSEYIDIGMRLLMRRCLCWYSRRGYQGDLATRCGRRAPETISRGSVQWYAACPEAGDCCR